MAKKKKEDDSNSAVFLYRANKTLFDMQCMMDVNGATDLCIDLIMAEPSPNIFLECIQLAIALLNGGNGAVQVSTMLGLVKSRVVMCVVQCCVFKDNGKE